MLILIVKNEKKIGVLSPYQSGKPLTIDVAIERLKSYIDGRKSTLISDITAMSDGSINRTERQTQVFEKKLLMLEDGETRGYIVAPGGFGKSHLIKEDILAFRPHRALVLGPTNIIVNQIYEDLALSGQTLLDVGVIDKSRKEYGRHITVSTYQSCLKGVKEYESAKAEGLLNANILDKSPLAVLVKQSEAKHYINLDEFDLVIYDESHRALGDKTLHMLREKFTHETIAIGYTATPMYSYEKQVSHLLGREIDRIGAIDSAMNGWISPFKIYYADTDLSLDDVELTEGTVKEFKQSDLSRVINSDAGNYAALEAYNYKEFYGRPCLVFCVDVAHAITVAKLFNESGILAAAVYGGQDNDERNRIIKDFKEGRLLVVTSADVMREGFNYEGLEVAFNLRPMRSYVAVEQRFYRPTRLDPNNPNKFAKIVEFRYRSELPSKIQVTIDQLLGTAQIAYNKEIAAIMGSELFMRSGPVMIVDPKSHIKRALPELSGLKCIVHDPIEVMRVSNKMAEKRLDAKRMPDGWVAWSEFLTYHGINQQWALSVLEEYRKDKKHVDRYIEPRTNLVELCISPKLQDKIVRIPPLKRNQESITEVLLSMKMMGANPDKRKVYKAIRERFGDGALTKYDISIDRPPVSYMMNDIANELRKEVKEEIETKERERQKEQKKKSESDLSFP